MLFDVVRLSIDRYRANPIIVILPLVSMVFELAIPVLTGISGANYSELRPGLYALVGFGAIGLSLIVSFLTLVGKASIASQVVLGGRASLRDWVKGVVSYSRRALGAYAVYLVLIILSFIPLIIVFWYAMMPQVMYQIWASQPEAYPSTLLAPTPTIIAISWVGLAILSLFEAALYMWLASLIFEGTDVLPSISGGIKAVRASGRTFLGFVVLFIVVSGIANLVENIPLYLGIYTPQAQGGLPTVTHLTSQLMKAIFSPIWLLIALTLYRGSSSPPRFTQTGASSVEPGD